MSTKTYKIGEREFQLKEELTLRERKETSKFLNQFNVGGEGIFQADTTLEQICEFFSLVLVPTDKKQVEENYFEQITDKMEVEIITDFFVQRMKLSATTLESLKKLTAELIELEKK